MMPWIVLFAIGAVQAAMLSLALWRRGANPQANRVLSVWLAIIAVDLAIKAGHLSAPQAGLDHAYRIARLLPFLYASLFHVYVRALTTGRGFAWSDLGHAGGFAFVLAWAVWRLASAPVPERGDWAPAWFDPLMFAWAGAYLATAVLGVQRYRRALRQHRSDADRQSLRWIVLMAACQLVVWGIAVLHWQLSLPHVDYLLIYGAVAAWVCVVGWCSLSQPPVVTLPQAGAGAGPAGDEARASADDPRAADVEARLSQLMVRDQLYREPALTIAQLARRSGYPEYLVSAVINRRCGGNFWDYVTGYRIAAIRTALADPDEARTILDIAFDAGFTAKSTFNASFKRIVGVTPSEYRRGQAASTGDAPPRPASRRRSPG